MLKILQIIFTVISALFLAALLPAGAFGGWQWALVCVLAALIFFVLMRICKIYTSPKENEDAEASENSENKKNPPQND